MAKLENAGVGEFSGRAQCGVGTRGDRPHQKQGWLIPRTNVNNEGRKNIEQDTLISSKEKNIVKAKEAVVPTPPALLNNISSPVKNPVHLRFDRSTKNYDSNTNDSVLESAAQSEKNARK